MPELFYQASVRPSKWEGLGQGVTSGRNIREVRGAAGTTGAADLDSGYDNVNNSDGRENKE